jgi:hypothetical protein
MAVKTYIHSIPVRLRLRDEQQVDPAATDELQTELRNLPGIQAVDFHPTPSSLVVRYETTTLAPSNCSSIYADTPICTVTSPPT